MKELAIKVISEKIYWIRGKKIMLDRDLAKLYGVKTRVLNQAVKRNKERFPSDFMFKLNAKEMKNWRSQFVISNQDKIGLRWSSYAFTENGVAMLSSVLQSKRAIQVNVQIMRTFTKIREMLRTHESLRRKIEAIEKKFGGKLREHDERFHKVFEVIRRILEPPIKPKRQIGFHS